MIEVSSQAFGLKIFEENIKFGIEDKVIVIFQAQENSYSVQGELRWKVGDRLGFMISEKSNFEWKCYTRSIFAEINLRLPGPKAA